jgi:formate-dependent nitrite reductase membrane component NrfD
MVLGRWRDFVSIWHRGACGVSFAVLRAGVGFFVAAYTGVLLAASNQPLWSDTRLLGALFLASAATTGTALMLLLRLPSAAPASLGHLQQLTADFRGQKRTHTFLHIAPWVRGTQKRLGDYAPRE